MANTSAYIPAFEAGIRVMLPQQKVSKLMGILPEVKMEGKRHMIRRMGSQDLANKTTAFQQISPQGGTYTFRGITATPQVAVLSYETEDEVRAALTFQNEHGRQLAAGLARKYDYNIIGTTSGVGGLLGTASTGEDGTGTQAITQTITASAGLNWNILMQCSRTFNAANVDPSKPKYFIATAKMYEQLLVQNISSSNNLNLQTAAFQNSKIEELLSTGQMQQLGGWNLIMHTDPDLITSSTAHIGIAFVEDAVAIGMATPPKIEVMRDTSRFSTWNVTAYLDMGSVRLYEEGVIQVNATVPAT